MKSRLLTAETSSWKKGSHVRLVYGPQTNFRCITLASLYLSHRTSSSFVVLILVPNTEITKFIHEKVELFCCELLHNAFASHNDKVRQEVGEF